MHRNKHTAVAAIGATCAIALGVGGCSSAAPATSGEVAMYAWVAGAEEHWGALVGAAQEQLDDVTLTYEGPAFAEYWTQLRTRYSGGDAPCIVATQADKTGLIDEVLTPLEPLIADTDVELSDFNQAILEGYTVDDELLGLPYDASPMVMYYNKSLFAKHGVAEPTADFTLDEFEGAASALSGDGDFGFAYGSSWFWYSPFAIASGATWSDDGELDLSDPALADSLQAHFDLAANGYAQPLAAGETATQQDAFASGNVGMIVGGTWDYPRLVEAVGEENLGVASIPGPSANAPQMLGGSGYGIAASCENQEEAAEAIAALVSAETQTFAANDLNIIPSRTAVLDAYLPSQSASLAEVIARGLANGEVGPTVENWTAADTLLTQYLPEGFSGARSAADILDTVQSSAAP